MQTTNFFAIGMLVLGLALGGGAGWFLGQPDSQPLPEATGSSQLPEGFHEVTILSAGLKLALRQTDQVANLKYEGKKIGYKLVDRYATATGAQVDIILDRVEDFFDLPTAKNLDAYRENVNGLNIQKTIDVSINGWKGLKQLYTAQLGQKRGDGTIIKRPTGGLLRYVILAPDDRIILLKSSGAFQTYLDTVAANLHFIPINSDKEETDRINLGTDIEVDVVPESSSIELLNPTGTSEVE